MQDDLAAQLILYIVFPSFAIVDFLLGAVAKALGWYEHSLGNIVCSNSVTACAVWDVGRIKVKLWSNASSRRQIKSVCECAHFIA